MKQRHLSEGENLVLNLVQTHFGPHNNQENVAIHGNDEAIIWAKDGAGTIVMMVNLTTLAAMRADGTISSEADLLRDWLDVSDR